MAGTQAYNRYSYCFNNPLKFVDPTGEMVSYGIQWLPEPDVPYYSNEIEMVWSPVNHGGGWTDPQTGERYHNTGSYFIDNATPGLYLLYYENQLVGTYDNFADIDFSARPPGAKEAKKPFREVFAAMSKEEQLAWHTSKIRSREAFLEHPMGAAFMGFTVGGAVMGATSSLIGMVATPIAKGGVEIAHSMVRREAAKQAMNIPINSLNPTQYITKSKSDMQALFNDIRANGVREPIKYVEHNGVRSIVDGHHRFYATQRLGIQSIPGQQVKLPYGGYRNVMDLMLEPGKHPGYWRFIK